MSHFSKASGVSRQDLQLALNLASPSSMRHVNSGDRLLAPATSVAHMRRAHVQELLGNHCVGCDRAIHLSPSPRDSDPQRRKAKTTFFDRNRLCAHEFGVSLTMLPQKVRYRVRPSAHPQLWRDAQDSDDRSASRWFWQMCQQAWQCSRSFDRLERASYSTCVLGCAASRL
jgi:hypothetical protein